MRKIQASEAKTHLLRLLDEVEKGETVVITRHGKPIARLTPEQTRQADDVAEIFEKLKELRKSVRGKTTLEEILSWRHEGHKY
jgi:prevent-host-death family protein